LSALAADRNGQGAAKLVHPGMATVDRCGSPGIQETVEASDCLHIDIGPDGGVVGIEILYPRLGPVDLSAIKERYGIELTMPFNFAA